jgi:hypothetical protein
LNIDSVDQKFNLLECGNFSQDAGTPGTERVIAFSQLAVKGLKQGGAVCRSRGLARLPVTQPNYSMTIRNQREAISHPALTPDNSYSYIPPKVSNNLYYTKECI